MNVGPRFCCWCRFGSLAVDLQYVATVNDDVMHACWVPLHLLGSIPKRNYLLTKKKHFLKGAQTLKYWLTAENADSAETAFFHYDRIMIKTISQYNDEAQLSTFSEKHNYHYESEIVVVRVGLGERNSWKPHTVCHAPQNTNRYVLFDCAIHIVHIIILYCMLHRFDILIHFVILC